MDNLTHTLAGMLLAEAIFVGRARETVPNSAWRRRAFLASTIGNNLPDADFVYKGITSGRLGYLLHHRGHTHTVVVALGLGLLTFVGVSWGAKRATRQDVGWLLFLSLLGPLVHIAMDFSNNYGVHPFWPFDTRWFYGDTIFIFEPWFWVAAIPPLAFAMHARVTRLALGALLLAMLAAAWTLSLVTSAVALALTLGSLTTAALSFKAPATTRIALGVIGSWLVLLVFALSSARARTVVIRAAHGAVDTVQDVVLTPMPGNPLCFDALVLGSRNDLRVARRATVAPYAPLAPSDADSCRAAPADAPTARYLPLHDRSAPLVTWHAEWSANAEELRRLHDEHCDVAAFFRYARAPYFVATGANMIAGDLRYDREPGLDFADIAVLSPPAPCPRFVPTWTPPRADWLRGAAESAAP